MGTRGKICLCFLFFAVFLVSATLAIGLSEKDPESDVCKHQCEKLREAEHDEKLRCKQRCVRYQEEKERREKEGSRHSRGGGRGGDNYSIIFAEEDRDLREMLGECQQQCQGSKGDQETPQCFRTCMERLEQEQGRRRGGSSSRREKGRKSDRDVEKEGQSNNPYVFQDHHFTTRLETEQGSVRVLQKFTDRSELFNGIENYRVGILEAEPQTFVTPNHWDADALLFVANGEGTISLINPDSRESFNIKRGDIFRVPAGIAAYLVNSNKNEKLVLVKILRSISVPGELQTFFGAPGENPDSSFLNPFSTQVLEAAYNTDREKLERLLGQQKQEQGIFKKATEEQIRALSEEEDGSRRWPFGERKGPYNIFRKDPSVQNDHGRLHEVDSKAFPDLRDINVAFSFFNITQGSMAGPFYNTRTTTVAVVSNGEGWFEMACPHLSEYARGGGGGSGGSSGPSYEKVSSPLKRGTVVVFPAGHPLAIGATNNQNLEVIFFGINSDQNEWFPLAGKDNVMNQFEDEALEITFGVPAREVQEVINNQKERLFFKGPDRQGRAFI